ncbi:hypothetical protein SAMN04488005_3022 [Yoonia tamlensis]|uniref:Uncharacterized protein n=1 Tax=Yoonia tamlensis TaxID=390270 RepID=A0A1I6HVA5_9RHOB|nr:hypothetical protein [Yoonia tamlensis]SFR58381.1 hypothetical protein SAMN04488005_3022 [Yoonia tamlensis]
MHDIPKSFFATGAIFALIGMVWGIQMSATHDHTLSPAHGHLNLIGFVAMSIFGTYYALTPQAAAAAMSRVHFWLTSLTVVILAPGIALAIKGQTEMLAQLGSVLGVVSMGLFAWTVLRHGVGSAR